MAAHELDQLPRRLVPLMRAAIARCRLDLSGLTVLTEAASGAYVVTPVLAALAGAARVIAVTRTTRYGTAEEIRRSTLALARRAEVDDRIEIVAEKTAALVGQADIITNSGHVRPIDAEMVGWMKAGAVVSLMYEVWELRPGDVDLGACRARGIPVAGTNERHPLVDVFSFLGPLAVKALHDAQVPVYGSRVLVLCDNPFAPLIAPYLARAGAEVELQERTAEARGRDFDAVLVVLRPMSSPVFAAADARRIAELAPEATVVQYWGDVDRAACARAGLDVWPPEAPAPGHMAVLLSAIGPEPIVRLQAGGLKAGEVLARRTRDPAELAFIQPLEE